MFVFNPRLRMDAVSPTGSRLSVFKMTVPAAQLLTLPYIFPGLVKKVESSGVDKLLQVYAQPYLATGSSEKLLSYAQECFKAACNLLSITDPSKELASSKDSYFDSPSLELALSTLSPFIAEDVILGSSSWATNPLDGFNACEYLAYSVPQKIHYGEEVASEDLIGSFRPSPLESVYSKRETVSDKLVGWELSH